MQAQMVVRLQVFRTLLLQHGHLKLTRRHQHSTLAQLIVFSTVIVKSGLLACKKSCYRIPQSFLCYRNFCGLRLTNGYHKRKIRPSNPTNVSTMARAGQ